MSAPPRSRIPQLSELDLVVETPRLRLRPIAETDVDALWPYVSDPAFPKHMSWTAHVDRAETTTFVHKSVEARAKGSHLTWVIEHHGNLRGLIGFHAITWESLAWRVDRAELGYWLAPELWRQGLMTEATHAAMGFGFETLGLHKITVGCIVENVASRRVIEKVGFRFLGCEEEHTWRDGRWWSHLRYELTSTEWSDVTTTMPISRPLRT
jgi:ribosomal-protein-alanine N-acetyltransferase